MELFPPEVLSGRRTSAKEASPEEAASEGSPSGAAASPVGSFPHGSEGSLSRSERPMVGEVPSDAGFTNRWHRRRALFSELRALESAEAHGEEAGKQETEAGSIDRDERLTARLSRRKATLLEEAIACSQYQGRSAYLRATATGRDRRAPIAAKGGILFLWTFSNFGKEIGPERIEALRGLCELYFGLSHPAEALALIRRHLRAAQVGTSENLGSEEDLPSAPRRIRRRICASPTLMVTVCLCPERSHLLEENAFYSAYEHKSVYIRRMALGWDRCARVRAQCTKIAEWMEDQWVETRQGQDGPRRRLPPGQIGPQEWRRLEAALHQQFGVFLSGPGGSGETDVDGALRRGTRHLLGADPQTIAAQTPVEL